MTVPLDEGNPHRRRVGPFWLEEGASTVVLGAVVIGVFAVLFALAVAFRPS